MKPKLAIFLFCMAQAVCAQFEQPVVIESRQKRVSDTEIELVFSGRADPGWHVYGTDFAEGGPTRAGLTLETCRGAKPKGKLRATGKVVQAREEAFNMDVCYMEGDISFAQTLTLTGGDYEVAGYLTYGACNDQNCLPPTNVEFRFQGQGPAPAAGASSPGDNPSASRNGEVPPSAQPGGQSVPPDASGTPPSQEAPGLTGHDSIPSLLNAETGADDAEPGNPSLWQPVISELQAFGEAAQPAGRSLLGIFLLGLLGGFVALLTPCVWPVIPMTVSFFLKRSQDRARGVRDAVAYGLSIVVIYLLLGLLVTLLFGASALNALSTNAVFNILFFLMLFVFGTSFLGGFEITLPASWTNAVDRKSERTSGLVSIFLMAFTLSLVSFSCTGPIIGFLLVEVSTLGSIVAPAVGMLGFALALALPFTLFALFPAWLKGAPRSGNWMNVVKVSLGIIELAFSLKFLSVADLAYGWRLLDREAFLCLWIVLFALLGAYLLGWIRLPHDEDEYDQGGNAVQRPRIGVTRFLLALLSLSFALYMVPGLWGAPCKAVSAFAPPIYTQDFNLSPSEVKARFHDYDQGMAYARANHLPVMLDFTGYGCVNCRKMEAAVWTDPRVAQVINERYVLITLFVDDKTPLPEPVTVQENGTRRKLRTVGDRWSYLQRSKFGANAQPFYVLVDNEGHPLNRSYSYDEDIPAYLEFLNEGLRRFNN
ncbi:MAG: thioredoxin family protein [Bacteroidaceae bacterium]|nr:thioredoxin family protein [Bacteroidaceae bacterium]